MEKERQLFEHLVIIQKCGKIVWERALSLMSNEVDTVEYYFEHFTLSEDPLLGINRSGFSLNGCFFLHLFFRYFISCLHYTFRLLRCTPQIHFSVVIE